MKEIGCYLYDNNFIGKGSFSKVYIGYNKSDKEKKHKFAVKKIYKKNDEKYRAYVEKEIDIMKKLNHKNIIKLYESIYTEKYIFLILEYCDCDLHSYIKHLQSLSSALFLIYFYLTSCLSLHYPF